MYTVTDIIKSKIEAAMSFNHIKRTPLARKMGVDPSGFVKILDGPTKRISKITYDRIMSVLDTLGCSKTQYQLIESWHNVHKGDFVVFKYPCGSVKAGQRHEIRLVNGYNSFEIYGDKGTFALEDSNQTYFSKMMISRPIKHIKPNIPTKHIKPTKPNPVVSTEKECASIIPLPKEYLSHLLIFSAKNVSKAKLDLSKAQAVVVKAKADIAEAQAVVDSIKQQLAKGGTK